MFFVTITENLDVQSRLYLPANEREAVEDLVNAVRNGSYDIVPVESPLRKRFGGHVQSEEVLVVHVANHMVDTFLTTDGTERDAYLLRIGNVTAKFPKSLFNAPQAGLAQQYVDEQEENKRIYLQMRREAEIDPEGAFGGRGNNHII